MKICSNCGAAYEKKPPARPVDEVISLIRQNFEMHKVGNVVLRRMTAKEIAAVIGLEQTAAVSTMIGMATNRMGLKSGRNAKHRWIEMPPASGDDLFV